MSDISFKLDDFLCAWRTRFPGADIPPNVVECLGNPNSEGLNEVYLKCKTRVTELQNELHQQEFLASFLWDVVKLDKSLPSSPEEEDLDTAIPVPDFSPSDPPDSYDNIEPRPRHDVALPVDTSLDLQIPRENNSVQESDDILRPQKPVPAPRPSTHVPSVKERASVFMMQGVKDTAAPLPKLPARGNSLDSKSSPSQLSREDQLPLPPGVSKKARPDPPAKPRKPVHNYEEIDIQPDIVLDNLKPTKPNSFRKQTSFESKSFKEHSNDSRSSSTSSNNTDGGHILINSSSPDYNTKPNYENVNTGISSFSSFKPISKPKTSSLSPKLHRGSPVYSSRHGRDKSPAKHSEEIYDEPIPVTADVADDDGSSSDEEPIYHNLMLLKKQQQQSMDSRLFGSVNIHKQRLERDAKKLSCRFSVDPNVQRKSVKPIRPPVMRPISKAVISGVTEEESSTEPAENRNKRCDSVESFGSGDRSLDSTGSSSGALDDNASWRKRQGISKASSQDSIYSEEIQIEGPMYAEAEKLHVRKNVVQSILASEQAYTKTLDVLNQYMNSLMGVVDKPQHQIIPKEDIDVIFFGIPALHKMHLEFIQTLQPRMHQWKTPETQVADLFKILALEECRVAPQYLKNYQRAISTIHKCSQDPRFRDLIMAIKVVGVKEAPSLEELLHKPVVRFQRNTLVLHDLIGCTPISHPDYDLLQKTLNIAQNFLETFQTPQDNSSAESLRYLARYSPIVERVGQNRKLRHVFLFNDMMVCSKQKVSGRKMQHEVKWAMALLDLTLDDKVSEEQHQVASHRMDISEQQRVIAELQTELKQEMKKLRGTHEGHSGGRSWSIRSHNKTIERLKKRLLELEAYLVINSPHLHFRLKNGKNGKIYTLLLSSDYERTNWRDAIIGLKCKVTGSTNLHSSDINQIINTVKLPKLTSGMLETNDDSWLFEEEQLFGCLHITIHRLVGLKSPADTSICVELDSFGHFFLKAKTETIHKCKEPCWNKDFELDLEGAQTLRLLCYRMDQPAEVLLGKCALELSKAWLRGDYQEQNIPINDDMSISVSLRYSTREKTVRKSMSSKAGVFGADIHKVAKREGKQIPIIVTSCCKEVERRGVKELGIYRVSGLSSDIVELKNAFDKNSRGAVALLQEFDINVVASMLKQYLRELPEPLFTDALYLKLVQGMGLTDPEAKEKYMLGLIQSLSDVTQATLTFLLDHMLRITEHSSENKMSLHNLATVFGPTLLQPTSKSDVPITMELFSENAKQAMAQTGILLGVLQIRQRGWDQNTKL